MIRLVVFDMAGTTVDEHNVVYKTVQAAIRERGINVALDEVLAEGAGQEKKGAIRSVLRAKGVVDASLVNDIFARFQTLLDDAYRTQAIVEQPNATAVFHALRQREIRVVLNTGYTRPTAEALVQKIGWQPAVDYDGLVTASDVAANRPNPDMIRLAMQQLGIADPRAVVKVGDSRIDIEEGKNAGCRLTIGITTGAQTAEQLRSAQPDYVINNLPDLLPIIDGV